MIKNVCLVPNGEYNIKRLQPMQSLQSSPNSEQSAFDIVNNILNSDQTPNLETQSLKIAQLSSICSDLINANKDLNQQIQFLKEELQAKTIPSTQTGFNDEYSEMQLDFTEIQENIKSYRTELEKYQNHHAQKLKDKNQVIDKLKEEVHNLQQKMQGQGKRTKQLQIERQALLQTKNTLLMELEQLQLSIKAKKYQTPKSQRKNNDKDFENHQNSFNVNIQLQLQKLIEKLIKELEHERYIKKKMNEESRRLQNNVVELEKEIIAKNNKIYELEINSIKFGKGYNNVSESQARSIGKRLETKGHVRQPSKISKNMRNFTFMELINDEIEVTSREKLIIAIKTIDFYLKKIENHDLSSLILESIKICNHNPINPNLIMIRATKELTQFQKEYEQSEPEVIWNLAFVLDSLFNQSADKDKDFGELSQERDIVDFLNQILENRGGNTLNTVAELRRMVQDAINLRK